jgi:dimethylhistidine N-methyltransferase
MGLFPRLEMFVSRHERFTLYEFDNSSLTIRQDVLAGMHGRPKEIPGKYLFDERGSQLFDLLTRQESYYLSRVEARILHEKATELAYMCAPGCMLVEIGNANSLSTHILLDRLSRASAYVPVAMSRDSLLSAARLLAPAYPRIEVLPVCADFTQSLKLPLFRQPGAPKLVFLSGSTIGNFAPAQAKMFLQRAGLLCGDDGGLLIGTDLRKSREMLEPAYDDPDGIAASLNLNVLNRINRECQADFIPEKFQHFVGLNDQHSRIELKLISQEKQTVRISNMAVNFERGEWINTMYAYKYDVDQFSKLAEDAGLSVTRLWVDPEQQYAVFYLVKQSPSMFASNYPAAEPIWQNEAWFSF